MILCVEDRLQKILRRCYPDMAKVLCLAFGCRYSYYTVDAEGNLETKIGEALCVMR